MAVEEAKTVAMTDLVMVDETHTTIMYSDAVAALVVDFLKNGRFSTNEVVQPSATSGRGNC